MYTSISAPSKPPAIVSPTSQTERISILDSLRGFAILGILLMNMPAFSLAGNGHDPSILNETGLNYYTWYFVDLIPSGTQRALFSMLFGAGIILFVRSAEKKAEGIRPADLFFRRQLWLMVFSLFDVFILLWLGDILLDYALFGMLIFTFRNLSPKALLFCAAGCMFFMLARENRDLYQSKTMIERGEAVALIDTTVTRLTPAQKEQLSAMHAFKEKSSLEKKQEDRQNILRRVGNSSYEDLYETRTNNYIDSLVPYLFFFIWDVLFFMFLGMAFFKMGILTAQAPGKVYLVMCIAGLMIGIFFSYLHLQPLIKYNFNRFDYTKNAVLSFYELGRVARALGIFGFIMLMYKSGLFQWLFSMMQRVGQMAFTNYLSQSLICGILFYSVGFGLYGKLERYEIYIVVAGIWLFQVIFSNIWLRYFLFGPFEWTWRSLTYWKLQPMKRVKLLPD